MNDENFSDLFEETIKQRDLKEGSDLLVQVLDINENYVTVSAALKSESHIPVDEFYDDSNNLEVAVGDTTEVEIDLLDNGAGETVLSRRNAKRKNIWKKIQAAIDGDEVVEGVIQSRVRGGYSVMLDGIRAFLPGSLADMFPTAAVDDALIGKTHQFKPIKINQRRNSVVLSRRAVIEKNMMNDRNTELLSTVDEGSKITGTVRAIVDYGAFIEIASGIFGLLHITDMSWKHTSAITDLMNVGDTVETVVLKIDRARNRVSLGMKQLQPDPWEYFERTHPIGSRIYGKVTKIEDYGIFVEIEDQLQGLVHTSEISWSRRILHPSKIVSVGDEVEVMILDTDKQRRRISLGIKQCKNNPWRDFATAYRKGDKITGQIRSINEFGLFVNLPGDIEGLVRMGDIAYDERGEGAILKYHKGQEIETVLLSIDPEKQRIALGLKQLSDEKFEEFAKEHLKGADLKIIVKRIEEKGAVVDILPSMVRGYLPKSEIPFSDDASSAVREEEEYEASLLDINQRNRKIIVSIKSRDRQSQRKSLQDQQSKAGKATTQLGALLEAAKIQEQQEPSESEEPPAAS